jgi:hypothetical protein
MALIPEQVQKQAHRYLIAAYGEQYVFAAPETFNNALERWIWALAAGNGDLAEENMARIEELAAARNRELWVSTHRLTSSGPGQEHLLRFRVLS